MIGDVLGYTYDGGMYCVECTKKTLTSKQIVLLEEGKLEGYSALLDGQDDSYLHGEYCGNLCHTPLCPTMADSGDCMECLEEITLIKKDVFAVRVLQVDQNDLIVEDKHGNPLYHWYCRVCMLKQYQRNSKEEGLITGFEIVRKWDGSKVTRSENVYQRDEAYHGDPGNVDTPIYYFTPMKENDPRLHGRECSNCADEFHQAYVDGQVRMGCVCYYLDQDNPKDLAALEKLRNRHYILIHPEIVYTQDKPRVYHLKLFASECNTEGFILRTWTPVGYGSTIWLTTNRKRVPDDMQIEIKKLQKFGNQMMGMEAIV